MSGPAIMGLVYVVVAALLLALSAYMDEREPFAYDTPLLYLAAIVWPLTFTVAGVFAVLNAPVWLGRWIARRVNR